MRLFFLFLFGLVSCLSAQDRVIPLFPEGAPCPSGFRDSTVYLNTIGRLIRRVAEPEIHHYQPVPRSASGSAILIVPGGGYVVEAWDIEGEDIARRMAQEGIHAFVLKHRLPRYYTDSCKYTVALGDAQRGIQTIRLMADSLGIDRDRVAIMGFSAGGHLAASASVHHLAPDSTAFPPAAAFSSRPDLSLPIYAVLSMDDSPVSHGGSMMSLLGEHPDPAVRDRFNLPRQVHPGVPPTFLAHASDDEGVVPDNSLRYYRALHENRVPASLHVFSTGGHGFGTAKHFDGPVSGWLDLALQWMRWHGF
ncbi:alpha/beta hydrolase [Lewinella sp. W8]|uniref:alpha/beta hydrolase n=1 Tax=Lewinella sp. W8 TaxID=2528208 RepID=UPI001067730D|nr:alpha/beta hydrolase [Lewinella sp. W8]MTB50486.1 alpha/beta hydrolase fold domain-containing protein [Lewinella sp. W8]